MLRSDAGRLPGEHARGRAAEDRARLCRTDGDAAIHGRACASGGSAATAPDYEAHYTLGVAYKNMGLYEDAMDEFHVSKSADPFYLDSCLMTALCLKDQHAYGQAIRSLETVLSDPRCQGAKGQAVRYELGMLYEAESQWEQAVSTYELIPSFHDVPQRLESLRGKAHVDPKEFRLAS